MIYTILTILFITSSFAKTDVRFVDACSLKDIRVSTPNGTKLLLKIDDLNPEDSLEVSITYRPAGVLEDAKPSDTAVYRYTFYPQKDFNSQGVLNKTLSIPKENWLWQVEQRHSEYRIWDAEVTWLQVNSRKAGSHVSSFYHSPTKETFFQILGPGLCQWESEATVDSKLFENNSTTWMSVTRERTPHWDQGTSPGMSIGPNNNTGGSMPLSPFGQTNSILGWVFKDWQKQFNKQHIFRNEIRYTLSKDEAGIFTKRMSFNRHEVKKYSWLQTPGSCGEYAVVSKGELDIGRSSEDFVVIPKNFYGRPEKLKEFINTVRPTLNNCGENVFTGPQHASDIIPDGMNGILYYYQLENNRSSL